MSTVAEKEGIGQKEKELEFPQNSMLITLRCCIEAKRGKCRSRKGLSA